MNTWITEALKRSPVIALLAILGMSFVGVISSQDRYTSTEATEDQRVMNNRIAAIEGGISDRQVLISSRLAVIELEVRSIKELISGLEIPPIWLLTRVKRLEDRLDVLAEQNRGN